MRPIEALNPNMHCNIMLSVGRHLELASNAPALGWNPLVALWEARSARIAANWHRSVGVIQVPYGRRLIERAGRAELR